VLIPPSASRPPLSYYDSGQPTDADRRPVVLLHSIGTDHRLWEQQLSPLAERHRVLAPDARGHGRSGWVEGAELSIDHWVEDLDLVLDHAGVEAVTLVGLSMGGVEALAYTLAHPDRVRGLVLADTFAELDAEVAGSKVEGLVRQAHAGMGSFADSYLDQTLTRDGDDVASVRAVLKDAIANVPVDAYVASTRACFGVRLARRLREVRTRTLVLWGALDTKTPRGLSEQLAAGIPNSTLEEVPAAGHLSAVENPEAFTKALTHFLDAVHDDTRTGRTDSWR
jgi:3-oxoadipate enol-lactonase